MENKQIKNYVTRCKTKGDGQTSVRTTQEQLETFISLLRTYSTEERMKHLRIGQMVVNMTNTLDIFSIENPVLLNNIKKEINE